jgi:hypothetical protein
LSLVGLVCVADLAAALLKRALFKKRELFFEFDLTKLCISIGYAGSFKKVTHI